MKKTKKVTKVAIGVMALVIAATLVGATLLTSFGTVTTTVTAKQSVQIDGKDWDEPITHDFEAFGGCCKCFEHTVTNHGCEGIWLDWKHTPIDEGIYFTVYEKEPSCCTHILETLVVTALDGQAQWDDYDVYVDGQYAGTYTAVDDGGIENWVTTSFDLTPLQIQCCGTHTVKIDCTNGPWTYFNSYGQLAVDYVALYCEEQVICDSVDIGNPTSEAGHTMVGWGPIEPAAHGGNYGGINDCRCTWFYECPQNDASWATIELACEDCYETGDCDCEHESMELPFFLDVGETIDLCFCYKLDMFIAPGIYTVASSLVQGLPPSPPSPPAPPS